MFEISWRWAYGKLDPLIFPKYFREMFNFIPGLDNSYIQWIINKILNTIFNTLSEFIQSWEKCSYLFIADPGQSNYQYPYTAAGE